MKQMYLDLNNSNIAFEIPRKAIYYIYILIYNDVFYVSTIGTSTQ